MPFSYVELHARSAFSFLRGASIPEDYALRCSELGQQGMALLDIDGVYGAPRFHQAMKKAGHAPYLGAEVTCSDGARYPLLIASQRGYQNLCRMISRMKLRTAKHPKPGQEPAATPQELAEFSEGLLCLTGSEDGPLAQGLRKKGGRAAVERLQQRLPIEFVLVKGLPHAEAMRLYQKADLVIDQVLAGWYGGFAVEAMAMGKPVACYIRETDLQHIPEVMRAELPLIRLTPETIEADLTAALTRRAEWPRWGEQARAFVLRWHHPRRIAAAMLRAYQDPLSRFQLESV